MIPMERNRAMSTIYELTCKSIQGKEEPLSKHKGKVLLIVNTASQCGFTPQFQGLEQLYQQYHAQGLEILGFPCNQFGSQDPGNNEEILAFCQTKYGVTFPMFGKIAVNGPDAHPLFQHLKAQAPGILGSEAIKWNFTKFLVDKTGAVKGRYAPTTKPSDLESDITALLNTNL
jgi:glutathione peroxidase